MLEQDFKEKADYTFRRVVNNPHISGEHVAEFTDNRRSSRKEVLRYNETSLKRTIENMKVEAENYPSGKAKANLVQLTAARIAFDKLQK